MGTFLEHIGINLQTSIILRTDTFYLFLYTSRIKWAMLADTLCSTQSTCQKSGTAYFRNILCVWCEIWQ